MQTRRKAPLPQKEGARTSIKVVQTQAPLTRNPDQMTIKRHSYDSAAVTEKESTGRMAAMARSSHSSMGARRGTISEFLQNKKMFRESNPYQPSKDLTSAKIEESLVNNVDAFYRDTAKAMEFIRLKN